MTSIAMIEAAAARMAGHTRRTPLLSSPFLDDIAGRRVLVDGQPIETTAKEFDLLRLLSQHPGQVLTREQIMERIWGEHFTLRTIDNFIARLRGKIELNPDAPLHLETVRGVGYRYNP